MRDLLAVCCFVAAAVLVWAQANGQPYRGSPDLEPGLQNRDDILLFEDFEYPDWMDHFSSVGNQENLGTVTDPVFQGSQALVVRAPLDSHYGTSIIFRFTDEGLAEPEEIYFRYYVFIDSSWNHADSDGEIGKFPGFGGTYGVAGWGGRPCDGTNGWSARMMNWDDGATHAVGFYTYHADMPGTYGTNMRWDPDLDRNRWYCIEAYVRMNSINGGVGNNDGILRGWVDGQLAFEQTDVRFRHVDTLKIETIWFNIYVGGSWTADHDMELYFDNVVVSPNPIGCYQPDGPGPDGGVGRDGASDPTADAGADEDADTNGGGVSSDSGCGCKAGSGRSGLPPAFLAVLLLAFGLIRRREGPR